jgi:hypothetical protein
MSRFANPYGRVLKRYRWEYLKLEAEAEESRRYMQELQAVKSKLESDVNDLLSTEAQSDLLSSAYGYMNILAITAELEKQKTGFGQQIQENQMKLRQLKKRLLSAKSRMQHARDKFDAAQAASQTAYVAREMTELNDLFAARNWAHSHPPLSTGPG